MNKRKILGVAISAILFLMPFSASANTNGIDTSNYQGSSLSYFQYFKRLGDNFNIVKLGGHGGGEGYHYQNPARFAQVYNSAQAGMQTAGYFWGQFGDSVTDAQLSAQMALNDASGVLAKGSYIALDYEAGAGINKENNTTAILAFMDYIKASGYKPMLYSGAYYIRQNVNLSRISQRYPNSLWIASYPTTANQPKPNMNWFPQMDSIKIWQYADNHYGVDGDVMVSGSLDNDKSVNSVTTKPYRPATTNNTKKTYYATFSGVYVVDYWVRYNGKLYGVNYDMSIKPIDYNNYIPISPMVLTDRYGRRLNNQYIQGNNGRMEFFTMPGKYKVLYQTNTAVELEIAGEPVWINKAFVNIK
ncbi:GH25 family lysozyme [Oenococcus alcoholitolerans]|uniref:GH25 family lysozyme n=1 Tax=Oenococcus alcoholitolerans TaxID=931074 RepID=UPI003F6F410D